MEFAFFIVAFIVLAAVSCGLAVVDRIVAGVWGIHPVCKNSKMNKFGRHTSAARRSGASSDDVRFDQ